MHGFIFSVGRLAIARYAEYQNIGGYRKLWWRFWWQLPIADIRPILRNVPHLEQHSPTPNMHWNSDGVYPVCGASAVGAAWTLDYTFATCEECKLKGWPLHVQHSINRR